MPDIYGNLLWYGEYTAWGRAVCESGSDWGVRWGEKLDGVTIETLNLAKDNRFGKPKHVCATCNPLLAMFRITATSG